MRKLLSTMFSALMVLTCISPVQAEDTVLQIEPTPEAEELTEDVPSEEITSETELENPVSVVQNTTETTIDTQSAQTDLCYISAFDIDERKDGTAPFDGDDTAGNDSSDSNGIIRTFDTVNYTLKYTTALKNTATQGVDSGNIMIEFNLPCDPVVARFNKDSMQWCLDMVATYTYSDGTTSTTWDKSKQVVNQKVTGRRFLQNTSSQNVIPGTGTLSVGLEVKMSKNGEMLKPSFFVWAEGNAEAEKKELSDAVNVTAVPRYDIELKRNGSVSLLGYYNLQKGEAYSEKTNADDVYGRLEAYSVALRLQNTSPDKKLMGIEFPQGDITFDIKFSETMNEEDVTYQEKYTPILWDYVMNGEPETASALQRDMTPLGQSEAYKSSWQTKVPFNKNGGRYRCYDGGKMLFAEDANDSSLLHVTLSNYHFEITNFEFPIHEATTTVNEPADFTPDIGYFSVGILQVICQFPDEVETTENILFKSSATNLNAKTLSNAQVTTDVNLTNNNSNIALSLFPKGAHSKRQFFVRTNSTSVLNLQYHEGNASIFAGSEARIQSQTTYSGDSYLSATNILQKFDDSVIKLPEDDSTFSVSHSNPESQIKDTKLLFAAKPDKSGWKNEEEMNNTMEEQLIYFETLSDLNNAGYTCVGYLYEVRNSQIMPSNTGGGIALYKRIYIPESIPSGTVTWTTNDVRSWNATTEMNQSWTDVVYNENIKAYGLGDTSWKLGTYTDNYTKPTYTTYTNYKKVTYENGTIVSGHTNSYIGGNSLLIISDKTSVSVKPNDKSGNNPKTVYDMDAGERTASFRITPTITTNTANTEINSSEIKDGVTITAVLPKELHFENSEVTPESVTMNENGTTTVVWAFKEVVAKDGIKPFVFTVNIGEEGTENDVYNNQNIPVTVTITSKNDPREIEAQTGKLATTSISIIKLASSSVTKRALNPIVERGEEFTFRLRYSNLSEVSSDDTKIYDVMPYKGDENGSVFSGDYVVTSISADYEKAKKTLENFPNPSLLTSSSEEARSAEVRDAGLAGNFSDVFSQINNAATDGNVITWNINKKTTAFSLLIGNLQGKEYIDIYITCKPVEENGEFIKDSEGNVQQAGDVYRNKFYQNSANQAAAVISNTVETRVVKRNISGILWDDANSNGIRETTETAKAGMTVSLYRTTPSNFAEQKDAVKEINGKQLYTAYTTNGQKVAKTETNESGSYLFESLEAGEYVVTASGGDDYGLTRKDSDEDDTLDSEGTLNGNVKDTEWAVVESIVLPDAENMTNAEYTSEHNDVGYIPPKEKKVSLSKEWDDRDNYDNSRPEEITVSLLNANGTEIEKTFGEAEEWKTVYTTGTYYRGRENEIEFSEEKVPWYSGTVSREPDGNYVLTNHHLPSVILRTGGKGLMGLFGISAAFAGIAFIARKKREQE